MSKRWVVVRWIDTDPEVQVMGHYRTEKGARRGLWRLQREFGGSSSLLGILTAWSKQMQGQPENHWAIQPASAPLQRIGP